jgi:hypothetical protein
MKKFLFHLVTGFILWSCTSTEKEVQLMPIDYLTAGNAKTWKLVKFKTAEIDQLSECLKDDEFIFYKKSQIYEWKKAALKCYAEDEDISLEYKLSADGKSLTFNEYIYQVNILNVETLEIETVLNGDKQILTYARK